MSLITPTSTTYTTNLHHYISLYLIKSNDYSGFTPTRRLLPSELQKKFALKGTKRRGPPNRSDWHDSGWIVLAPAVRPSPTVN